MKGTCWERERERERDVAMLEALDKKVVEPCLKHLTERFSLYVCVWRRNQATTAGRCALDAFWWQRKTGWVFWEMDYFYLLFVLYTFNWKFGLPFLCMVTADARAVLTISTYMCCIFMHPNNGMHSCQPLLGINFGPEFVNLCFPSAGWGLLFFLLVAAAFWIASGTCGSGRKK